MKQPKLKTIEWSGAPISKSGMFSKIPLSRYHSADICDGPSVSSSGLRLCFSKSPAHFYSEWPGNPNRVEREEKDYFTLGQAAHHLFLGEQFFSKLFAQQPAEYIDAKTGEAKGWNNNSTVCRTWNADRAREGRKILKPADVESLKGMAEALSLHPIVRAGALNGSIEHSLIWKDKDTGLWLKSRPDAIPHTSTDFVDLKSTTSVLWQDLQKAIGDHGYHAQAALARRAAKEVLGFDSITFTLIFVEKTAPFCVRVVTLKDSDLDRGDRQNRAALDTIARCLKSGAWPGPGGDREDAEYIELNARTQQFIDDKLQYGLS